VTETAWQPGPAQPRLAAATVDVWRADLASAGGEDARALLSPEERERAARFARPGDGERWTAARAVLRALLGACAGVDPCELRFAVGPHGKPALVDAPPLRFNLSHSADVALYALSPDREVGVDVELPRRAVDHVAIARRILGEAEAERLRALDEPRREREFLRAWVRWEAALKCTGTGIGGAGTASGRPAPWIHELDIGPPGAAALAVMDGPVAVRCWRWPAAAR